MAVAYRPVLAVENVHKMYGSAWALRDVSFYVNGGEVLGLLGPNGAGKTSLIRMILDLTRPDRGSVKVLGQEPSSRIREHIGYLPEERGLYPKQKVIEVLTYLVSLAGVSKQEARHRSESWLKRVGLEQWGKRRVRELSKGMQQKIQLGAALLHEPSLLILDEPFSGLDPINRRLVNESVQDIRNEGTAVIIATHMMSEVQELCDKVILLKEGSLILHGSISEVRERFMTGTVSVHACIDWQQHRSLEDLIVEVETDGDRHEIKLKEDIHSDRLLLKLIEEGISIDKFSRKIPTLDDVFMMALAARTEDLSDYN